MNLKVTEGHVLHGTSCTGRSCTGRPCTGRSWNVVYKKVVYWNVVEGHMLKSHALEGHGRSHSGRSCTVKSHGCISVSWFCVLPPGAREANWHPNLSGRRLYYHRPPAWSSLSSCWMLS